MYVTYLAVIILYQQVKEENSVLHLCALSEAAAGRILWGKSKVQESSISFILKVFIEPCHQMLSVDWLSGPFSLFLLKVSCETVI